MLNFDPMAELNKVPDAFNIAIDPTKIGSKESKDAQDVLRQNGLWPDEEPDD